MDCRDNNKHRPNHSVQAHYRIRHQEEALLVQIGVESSVEVC
jgi:hypothetical protein